jgi:hypothetical protein
MLSLRFASEVCVFLPSVSEYRSPPLRRKSSQRNSHGEKRKSVRFSRQLAFPSLSSAQCSLRGGHRLQFHRARACLTISSPTAVCQPICFLILTGERSRMKACVPTTCRSSSRGGEGVWNITVDSSRSPSRAERTAAVLLTPLPGSAVVSIHTHTLTQNTRTHAHTQTHTHAHRMKGVSINQLTYCLDSSGVFAGELPAYSSDKSV